MLKTINISLLLLKLYSETNNEIYFELFKKNYESSTEEEKIFFKNFIKSKMK